MNDAVAFADAAMTLPQIGREIVQDKGDAADVAVSKACEGLLERCQDLFRADACAIFFVRNDEAVLEACRGYTHPYGTQIPFETLRAELRYKVSSGEDCQGIQFDGITGWVASTGSEFSADSREEIRAHPAHAGKPDKLGVWDKDRPFRCVFAVPLMLRGRTLGVLKVENKRDPQKRGVAFDDTDKYLMRALAEFFSMTMENICHASGSEPSVQVRLRTTANVTETSLGALARKFDHCNMAKVLERFPAQIEIACEQGAPRLSGGPFKRVVLIGLGGSALPADVVNDAFAEKLRVPICVTRHYDLPRGADDETLIVASSFSGSTEEVLHAIECFPAHAPNVVVMSARGPLIALARARSYPVVQIPEHREPKGFQPRSALGYTASFLALLLSRNGLMDDPLPELEALPQFLRETDVRPAAEEAAIWLQDKIPVVYTDEDHLMSIARVAKIKINENSKRPSLCNAFPEVNHNEIIGFSNKKLARFGIVYLHDPASHRRIRHRFKVMERVFEREMLDHVGFWEWRIPGSTNVERVFAALAFADQCSYSLALLDGLDPTPVALIESFKQVLLKDPEP